MSKRLPFSFAALILVVPLLALCSSTEAQLRELDFTIRADFNGDQTVDCDDIDAWNWAYNLFSADPVTFAAWEPILDLSSGDFRNTGNDGIATEFDRHVLVREILGLSYGDANCDGVVDVTDMTIVATNFGQSGLGWAGGDFNGDGAVDEDDADAISRNWLVEGNGVDETQIMAVHHLDPFDFCRRNPNPPRAQDPPNCRVHMDIEWLLRSGYPWFRREVDANVDDH